MYSEFNPKQRESDWNNSYFFLVPVDFVLEARVVEELVLRAAGLAFDLEAAFLTTAVVFRFTADADG